MSIWGPKTILNPTKWANPGLGLSKILTLQEWKVLAFQEHRVLVFQEHRVLVFQEQRILVFHEHLFLVFQSPWNTRGGSCTTRL